MEDIQKLQLVVVHLVRQCLAQIKVVSSVSCSVFRDVFTPISLYTISIAIFLAGFAQQHSGFMEKLNSFKVSGIFFFSLR